MSGDERGGPYLRDKEGRRKPPAENRDRAPYWWEIAGFYVFKYWWVFILVGWLIWQIQPLDVRMRGPG